MEQEQLNFKFEFTDEFKQTTKFEQSLNVDCIEQGNIYVMLDEFKQFLLACGYSQEHVNSIQIIEQEE